MERITTITINNKEVPINGERNILELVRKANIDLPTFCYYSEMSIYGACRLCMVDVRGRGFYSMFYTQRLVWLLIPILRNKGHEENNY